ncbi:MAG TPA: DUF3037 domain-containing protein [Phycisphaerae bacterium]|nr:DUF3037 domain-containing protein [Phycisphaerae bacterium]
MTRKRAYYSVVQYVPDSGRAEAANVGVVLFVPSLNWIELRASETLDRVRKFFAPGKAQLARITIAIESLRHRIEHARDEFQSEADLAQFVAAKADAVRLTPPRVAMVDEPHNELNELYAELVGDSADTRPSVAPRLALPPTVARTFGELQAQRRVWRPGKIILPETNKPFDVPYAFKNGRVNYISPESLATTKRLDQRMESLGFKGRLIYKHPIDGEQGKLVILSVDPAADAKAESRFTRTMDDFNVRFVPNREAESFAREVEESAKPY